MQRLAENIVRVALLHHIAQVHYQNGVGDVLDDRQIVRNEHVRQSHFVLQFFQKIYYLRLNGNVKRGYGLVADDQLGLYGESARNTDTLALTAGKLVRIAVVILRLQSAFLHNIHYVIVQLRLGHDFVHLNAFLDKTAHGHTGRQRGIRILEHELHIRAERAHFLFAEFGKLLAFEENFAAVRFVQLENGSAQRGFTATGFAHDADGFTLFESKSHVVHRFEIASGLAEQRFFDYEILFQVLDFKKLFVRGGVFALDFVFVHVSRPPFRTGSRTRNACR